MSNFLSPMEANDNYSRFPQELFLDTTQEALEGHGFKIAIAKDPYDGSDVLQISPTDGTDISDRFPFNTVIVRVSPNGKLFAYDQNALRYLSEEMGLAG